jgi:hypothetical protein
MFKIVSPVSLQVHRQVIQSSQRSAVAEQKRIKLHLHLLDRTTGQNSKQAEIQPLSLRKITFQIIHSPLRIINLILRGQFGRKRSQKIQVQPK